MDYRENLELLKNTDNSRLNERYYPMPGQYMGSVGFAPISSVFDRLISLKS